MNEDKWSQMEDRLKDEAAEKGERFHNNSHMKTYKIVTRTSHGSYTEKIKTHSRKQAFLIHAAKLHHLTVKSQYSIA